MEFEKWSTQQVCIWLESIGMGRYASNFKDIGVDGSLLPDIKIEDLEKDISIPVRLHRVKIINEITKLKSNKENINVSPTNPNSKPLLSTSIGKKGIKEEFKAKSGKGSSGIHEIIMTECSSPSLILKCKEGLNINSEYSIGAKVLNIGRHSAFNEVVIGESFVSRKHCIIYRESDKCYLQDLGSMTGTFILAKGPIKLKEGQLIQLGGTEIQIMEDKDEKITLYIYEGPSKMKKVLVDSHGIKIGRDPSNGLAVPEDSQLSSLHASINSENGCFYIRDEQSTNKIWERLSAEAIKSVPYELSVGDIIKVGSSIFTLLSGSTSSKETPLDDAGVCKICFNGPSDAVIIPCGHNICCLNCASQIKQCPLCRIEILHYIKLYK